jgi:tRNA A37 threonylcarbamoyladenosine modification protein TsaB
VAILAFETSCDETSAAVVDGGRILSNVVSSQVSVHAEYGGVVPELAAREHLRNLIPITQSALRNARIEADQLSGLAATQGPGLPSALMVGLKAGQALAFALRRPFFGIHHHEAHLYSPWIKSTPAVADFSDFAPNVSLIDLVFTPSRDTTKEELNEALKAAAAGAMKGVLDYTDQPLVSSDFNHQPASSTVDSLETAVLEGKLARVVSWYDNEWGFSNRMIDTAGVMAKLL